VIITRIADGTMVYINRRAALRFGVPQDEAVGRQAPDYWQDPAARGRMIAALQRDGLVTDLEAGLKTATGEPFWAYLSVVTIRQQDEDMAFVSFADITERRHAEQAMREAHGLLQTQLGEIRLLQAKLAEMAIRDGLTGLFNRRYLDETLEREIARARREGYPLSLVMIDVDRFKEINDTYGHQAGDEVLRALASQLHAQVRAEDVPCRYGGEEFLILLPGMPLAAATERAEAWRAEFSGHVVRFGNFELRNTASFGVASYPEHGKNPDELTRCADQALYRAKGEGRNRVVSYTAAVAA
jgi:diguanylate cyclase (GGDEF)-like protein/PAS domain S-box-containing protein